MAVLLAGLYDRSKTTFTLAEAAAITKLRTPLVTSLLYNAIKRGLVTRLKRGIFVIVPPELGSTREYSGNPYLVGRHLAGDAPCFVSHASAMEIHRMVTQPQLDVFLSSPKRIQGRVIQGTKFHFVQIKQDHFFGTMNHWASKQEAVNVSDLERTILDGLRQPEYCGGVTDVAKGLWMRHTDINPVKLIDYALRLNIGAVNRRLGYLLEFYDLAPEKELARLRKTLTQTYAELDPVLPKEGAHLARWRVQLNIHPEELDHVRET